MISHYETELKLYRIEDGETHWLIAESASEAMMKHAESLGYDNEELYLGDMGPIQLGIEDPAKSIRVTLEGEPEMTREQTAAEWVQDEDYGVGLLCSTAI